MNEQYRVTCYYRGVSVPMRRTYPSVASATDAGNVWMSDARARAWFTVNDRETGEEVYRAERKGRVAA